MNEINYIITYLDDEGQRALAFPQAWPHLKVAKDWKDEIDGDCPGRNARVECLECPMGSVIWFGDSTSTVPTEEMGARLVLVEGHVRGLPVVAGEAVFVPVGAWVERDGGRTLRTVHVYAGNIISVEPPSIKAFDDGSFGGEPLIP